jgi:hypothetical protein
MLTTESQQRKRNNATTNQLKDIQARLDNEPILIARCQPYLRRVVLRKIEHTLFAQVNVATRY